MRIPYFVQGQITENNGHCVFFKIKGKYCLNAKSAKFIFIHKNTPIQKLCDNKSHDYAD